MLKRAAKIGFVLLASPTEAAQERIRRIAEDSRKYIQKQEGLQLFCPDEPVMTLDDAARASSLFRRSEVDALVIQHGTASPVGLTAELARDVGAPLAMWGIPEAPLDGNTLTCGSMTGLIAHSAALTRIGRRFSFVHGLADSEEARRQLDKFIRTVVVRAALRRSKVAFVGYKFESLSSAVDELLIKNLLGVDIEHVALADVIRRIDALPDEEIEADISELRSSGCLVDAKDAAALRRSCAAFTALKKILVENDCDAAAIKCRPQLIETYKLGMEAVCSRLTDAGIPAACGGDIDGALTMLVQLAYTERPAFLADWIQRDEKTNQALFWHDGSAPATLANPKFEARLEDAPRNEGNVAFDFPLKSGQVTIARLLNCGGRYKMLVARGRAVEPTTTVKGTHVSVRFEAPVQNVLEAILAHGFPQHYSIVYEDIKAEIVEFANQLAIEVVSPGSDKS
ncbi:MAG: hypothetical protein HQ592_10005 [Planctomycetes bacterium]|nr:hypothetical protein [Planctomycetota bacterium]